LRLWVDTDVGTNPDDAVALICARAHPAVELVGVSTVDGDSAWRADVARELVDTPVIDGAALEASAVSRADPDALLAIGPLTNVARLMATGYRPPRLAVMGGTRIPVDHRGARQTIEHNFGAEPAAAVAVLHAGPLLLCPLDVTVRMGLDGEETDRLATADNRLRRQLEAWARREPGTPVCLHDPLALLALLGEPVVKVERRSLVIGPDGAIRDDEAGAEHDVVVDVDARAAKARIFDLLEKGRR